MKKRVSLNVFAIVMSALLVFSGTAWALPATEHKNNNLTIHELILKEYAAITGGPEVYGAGVANVPIEIQNVLYPFTTNDVANVNLAATGILDTNIAKTANENTLQLQRIIGSVGGLGPVQDVFISGNYAYVADSNGLHIVDISNPRSPIIVGRVDTTGASVFISGNYAYLASGWEGLQIIDISNPSSPFIVGSVDTPGTGAPSVLISGNHAFVADGEGGLQIIDISNPYSPFIVGSIDTPGRASGVSISGDHAYVADGEGGLQIIDISNPYSPFIVGSIDTPGRANGVSISGNYAFVADRGRGLQIIDISNPSSPVIVSNVHRPGSVFDGPATIRDVSISGNYAFITKSQRIILRVIYSLEVINISNPSSPVIIGRVNIPVGAENLFIFENHAYLASGWGGLQIIDISNPRSPVMVGGIDVWHYQDVFISGNYAYVADGSGLQIVDISNPRSPFIVERIDTPGSARGLFVSRNYAYVADGESGLQIIDVSNPRSPVIVGSVGGSGANSVFISGNYAYVADGDGGLRIIDVSNPRSPVAVGSVDTPGWAMDVFISGSYAFIADGWDSGLQIIDISNPISPVIVGNLGELGYAGAVFISGNYAFVTGGWEGSLQIIDVSNPRYPVKIGSTPDAGNMMMGMGDVFVVGNYAYIVDGGWEGLQIVDISNPRSPVVINSIGTPGDAHGVFVVGNYAFIADGWRGGLQIIDISDPQPRFVIGNVDTPGHAEEVFSSGNYAYIVDGWEGNLQIIDISNPRSPVIVSSVDTPSYPQGVFVSGNYAYVADGESGLQIIDISNPRYPFIVGGIDTPTSAKDVFISGNYAFVADTGRDGGLRIIDISDPSSPFIIGSVDIWGGPSSLFISGNYAFIAEWAGNLQITDISDPSSPSTVVSVAIPGRATDVSISGNYAYIIIGSGLLIMDISDPRSPFIVGSVDIPGREAKDIFVSRNYAFIAGGEGDLQIIDVSDPGAPFAVGSAYMPGRAEGVFISGNYAFVAGSWSGLQIIDISAIVGEPVDPPKVIATNPLADAIAAPVTHTITATFSELIQPGTLVLQMVAEEGAIVPSVKSVTVNYRTLVISLTETLAHGTGYGVLIEEGAVKDLAGNPNPAFGWAFLTAAATAPGESPVLISPADGEHEVPVGPVLKWHPVAGADHYVVQVARDIAFTNVVFTEATTSTSIQVDPALDSDTPYFWRVLAAIELALGPWSDVRSFTTVGAAAPAFAFEIGEKVRVAHTGGIGLRLRETASLLAGVLGVMPEGAEVTILGGPKLADGYTWWRVRYGDQEGWCASRYLARVADNRPPEPPINLRQLDFMENILPVGGTTSEDVVLLKGLLVDPDGDQVRLEVELRPVGADTGFFERATDHSDFVMTGEEARIDIPPLPDGDFRWRARTIDAGGLTSAWVSFGNNCDTASDFSISAHWPPVALFNFEPTIAIAGETITFDASASHDRDGDIVSFHWDFGDNNTALGKQVKHTFAADGRYTVTLTVTDALGFANKHSIEVSVVSKELRDTIDHLVDKGMGHLDSILQIAEQLAPVADYFHEAVEDAAIEVVVTGVLSIISHAAGVVVDVVDLGTVGQIAVGAGEKAVEAIAGYIIRSLGQGEEFGSIFLPSLQAKIEGQKDELIRLRDDVLNNMAELSPEQIEFYIADLQSRELGNLFIRDYYETKAMVPVEFASLRQRHEENWMHVTGKTLFDVTVGVGKFALKIATGGLAAVLIPGGVIIGHVGLDTLDTLSRQDKDAQMLSLSMAALFDGFIQADRIFENISQGLENIRQQVPPATVEGEITSVNNVVEGRIEGWGFTSYLFTTRAYSEVTIKNTGNITATYDLFAVYMRSFNITQLWWVPEWLDIPDYLPIIVKEQVVLDRGESRTIYLEYLDESGGSIPRLAPPPPYPPGNIFLYLVGRDNRGGVYGLDMYRTNFNTTFITEEGEIVPEDKANELRVHQYPVRSEVQYMPETGNYILTIYVSNPFESPIAAELYQELPTGVEVISTENGVSDQDSISWELRLAAGERTAIQVVLQSQGEAASIEVPPPIIRIYDPMNDNWVGFQPPMVAMENQPPDGPANTSPDDEALHISLTPTLWSSPFADPDGDTHIASQWQITITPGDYSHPIFDSGRDTGNLTTISIASGVLNYATTYYWRVRYQDDRAAWSEWSVETSFTTMRLPADVTGDGRVDAADLAAVAAALNSRAGGPNWNEDADLNQDGGVDIFDLVKVGRNFGKGSD